MGEKVPLNLLPARLARLQRDIEKAVTKAIQKTADDAIDIVHPRVPKAFGELSDSLHSENGSGKVVARTVADAPHAAAVEVGSQPHTPDFEALLKWVRLRGFQGLHPSGSIRRRYSRTEGPTTHEQAQRVASLFREQEVGGSSSVGRHLPVDAAEQVARAISKGIQEHGTRPHWFMRESLPDIEAKLGSNINSALTRVK